MSDYGSVESKSHISGSEHGSRSNSIDAGVDKPTKKPKKKNKKDLEQVQEDAPVQKMDIFGGMNFRSQLDELKAGNKEVLEKHSKESKGLGAIMEEQEDQDSGSKNYSKGFEALVGKFDMLNSKNSKDKDRPRIIEKPTVNETTGFYEEQVKMNGSNKISKEKFIVNEDPEMQADDESEHKKVIFF